MEAVRTQPVVNPNQNTEELYEDIAESILPLARALRRRLLLSCRGERPGEGLAAMARTKPGRQVRRYRPAQGMAHRWAQVGLESDRAGQAIPTCRWRRAALFTMGDKDAGYVIALNPADGKILWTAKVGAAGSPDPSDWSYPGPRCTPTVSGDLVFAVNAWGEMVCVSAADGKEQWRKDFRKDFGGKPPTWGYSESPLVDGDQVVVTPGGGQGAMVALDKKTSRVLWQSKGFTDEAHYSSIVLAENDGTRQYVQLTAASVVGIASQDGRVLWQAPRKGSVAVIPTPIVDGNLVYVTSGYNAGSNLFKITSNAGKFSAAQVYANRAMSNHHGGVVKVGEIHAIPTAEVRARSSRPVRSSGPRRRRSRKAVSPTQTVPCTAAKKTPARWSF
jgi:hypothetical protein